MNFWVSEKCRFSPVISVTFILIHIGGIDNTSRQEELPLEDPPAYEAPPDYEDVIKVGMEDRMNKKENGRKSNQRRGRSRPSNSRFVIL